MVSRKPGGELDEHINLIFITGVLFGKTQNNHHFSSSNWPLSDGPSSHLKNLGQLIWFDISVT